MKSWIVAVLIIVSSVLLQAQTPPTVAYDAAVGITLTEISGWTPVLYVNNTAFVTTHTCTQVGAVITCTFPLMNISTALTASGNQTFELALRDVVTGEGPRSLPLVRKRPNAATGLRFP
jgi:hypothetical protein